MLAFEVPEDILNGIYAVNVIVPNDISDPCCAADEYVTLREAFIRVLPPPESSYQITSGTLHCGEETDGLGSDEIGMVVLSATIGVDKSLGELRVERFDFDDVDTGETRDMTRELFNGSGIGGLAMAILGFEVDSEDEYKELYEKFTESFLLVLETNWDEALAVIGDEIGKGIGAVAIQNWGDALAAAVTIGITAFIAWWAPPDLVIEDNSAGKSVLKLGELTSVNFPVPDIQTHTSANGIDVSAVPSSIIKVPFQYEEIRSYRSEEQDSTYSITLRINRF
jgi:hypothetical protein